MDFTDYLWVKLLVLVVIAAIVGWREGSKRRKPRRPE